MVATAAMLAQGSRSPSGSRSQSSFLLREQPVHELVDRAHEELVGVAKAVGGGAGRERAP